ncbi:hypothetical protein Efla_006754 [Eimeria flavescens]
MWRSSRTFSFPPCGRRGEQRPGRGPPLGAPVAAAAAAEAAAVAAAAAAPLEAARGGSFEARERREPAQAFDGPHVLFVAFSSSPISSFLACSPPPPPPSCSCSSCSSLSSSLALSCVSAAASSLSQEPLVKCRFVPRF